MRVCCGNFSNTRFGNEHLRHDGAESLNFWLTKFIIEVLVNVNFEIKKLNFIKVILFVILVYSAGHYTISPLDSCFIKRHPYYGILYI